MAVAENCNQMKWQAKNEEEDAIRLYERWGSHRIENWITFSMDKKTLLEHTSTK